jgi:hypothetical protein
MCFFYWMSVSSEDVFHASLIAVIMVLLIKLTKPYCYIVTMMYCLMSVASVKINRFSPLYIAVILFILQANQLKCCEQNSLIIMKRHAVKILRQFIFTCVRWSITISFSRAGQVMGPADAYAILLLAPPSTTNRSLIPSPLLQERKHIFVNMAALRKIENMQRNF